MKLRILVLAMAAVLVGLGFWQLQRLAWKSDLLAAIEAQWDTPVVEFTDLKYPDNADAWQLREFSRIHVRGTYDFHVNLRLMSKVRAGQVGVHIVSSLLLDDGSGRIIVDRGWAPTDWVPEVDDNNISADFTGLIRAFRPAPWMRPENDPQANEWYWLDRRDVIDTFGSVSSFPVYVAILPTQDTRSDFYPSPEAPYLDLPNNHLQYALTWFALAIGLALIYMLRFRQQ